MKLAENIKRNRRELNMTQEQLAEAMGVTVGAVSKWESGATTPDLDLLVGMADLFQTSIDALLGFQLAGVGAEEQAKAIKTCLGDRAYEKGRVKAEKALQNFPNHFEVVHSSALFFEMLGMEQKNDGETRQAIELYRRAIGLLNQNHDREISARTIQVRISQCYLYLGDHQKALDILMDNNEDGVNNDKIGTLLYQLKRYDEAIQTLSESMLDSLGRLERAGQGLANCLGNGKKDPAAALELMEWLVNLQESLYPESGSCYRHKYAASMLVGCAAIAAEMEDLGRCEGYLRRAKETAEIFDAAPDYAADKMRFYRGRSATAHDDFGQTAMAGILRTMEQQEENVASKLKALWEKLDG